MNSQQAGARDQRVAIVSGASRGIGRATALLLAEHGARVMVNYRQDEAGATETVRLISAAGGGAVMQQADVRDREQVQTMVDRTIDEFGRVDIVVNNAGILRDNFVTFMRDAEWADVLDTHLKGAFHLTKCVARLMMRQRSGCIVNVASDAALLGDMMRANYSAAKAGLLGLTRATARELAPYGIRINAVSPGIIETAMTADMAPAKRQKQLAAIPQRRFGSARDVAELIAFLVSEQSSYITGQVVCVDGGLHM